MLATERLNVSRHLSKLATASAPTGGGSAGGGGMGGGTGVVGPANGGMGGGMGARMHGMGMGGRMRGLGGRSLSTAKSMNASTIQAQPIVQKSVTNTVPQGIARSLGNVARMAGNPRF
jgi:hypothetical protein